METTESSRQKLHIYVDESSTLGLKTLEPYFIICAMILNPKEKTPIKAAVKKISKHISSRKIIEELHASEMSFSDKQLAHNTFFKESFSIAYMVAHKESLHENLLRRKNVCFNYFVYLTLWKVFETTEAIDIFIIIDTRSIKVTSEKSLEDYLNAQLVQKGLYDKNIFVSYGDSKNYTHLQAVDLFANALYAKYNFKKGHFYVYMLGRVCHRELFPQGHFDKNGGMI